MRWFIRKITTVLVLVAGGCAWQAIDDFAQKIADEAMETSKVSVNASMYYASRDRWPNSTQELKAFCAEANQSCIDVNWPAFAHAEFETLPNGELKIDVNQCIITKSGQGGGKMTITVPVPEPIPQIEFTAAQDRIDVLIAGKYFTSYRYGNDLTKPILFPVKSPSGLTVTRGFPLETIPGESKDHPHHTGIFFTYDKVNDDGFWGNTTSPPQIKHVKVTKMENGQLSTISHWVGKSGKVLLEEKRDMIFSAEPNEYVIDFNIMLTAPASPDSSCLGSTPSRDGRPASRDGRPASRGGQDKQVVFNDTKEGMFAIRVADWLKEDGGTGEYLNSESNKKEKDVWAKRAKWVRLEGKKDSRAVGIAILNHPDSTNYPTYWHARGYGLFSANPLGQSDFQKARNVENPQPFNLTLQPGQSALFKFRILIYEEPKPAEQLEHEFQKFAEE